MSLKSEIFEQPDVLRGLLSAQMEPIRAIAAQIRAANPQYVFLAARGTSDNAGRYASYLWGAHNRLPTALATPSLFTYYRQPPQLRGALVVGVSQSGQSPDIVAVLEEGRRQGCPTLAITNAVNSSLAAAADFVVDICAGEEAAVAATKTYTAQLMAVAMLSLALDDDHASLAALQRVPEWVDACLGLEGSIARIAERYRYMSHCTVIGRGYNYATAFEWSLKIKELTYAVAEPYSSADFLHGPIAMVERGFPVMTVAHGGPVFEDMLATLRRLRSDLHAELLVISDQSAALDLAQSPLQLPADIPEWLSPLAAIIPAQLFAYHLTRVKGYDPDQPRTIIKVTETH